MTKRVIHQVSGSSVDFETRSLRISTEQGANIRIDAGAALQRGLNPHDLPGRQIGVDICCKSGKVMDIQKLS